MFKDLKIVELGSVLAVPMVGTFFSELGAKLIKIENKTTQGDITRKWKLPSEKENDISAYYASANFNKKVIFLNLKDATDYQTTLQHIKTADIVLSNFKYGDAEKFKLDYKTLQQYKADIIYGEINGYGQQSKRTAFDVVLQAETGFMYMNGEPKGKPIKMPVALIDILAAHQLKEGLLCALIKKMKTNKGSKVSVALYDAAMSSLANQATNWLMAKHIAQPMGTQHPNIAPYGDMFLTKDDKYIVLAVGSDKQFAQLCKVLHLENLMQNNLFKDNKSRVESREQLSVHLQKAFSQINADAVQKLFLAHHIPAGVVKNMQEVFDLERAKKLIIEEKIEETNTRKLKTVVFEIE